MRSEGKPSRRSAPKVKSGCLTWVRRIKCDESKPACEKCSSTGRVCDGYALEKRFRTFEPSQDPKTPARASFRAQQKSTPPILSVGRKPPAENLGAVNRPFPSLLKLFGSPDEQRALEFFLARTAPALGGFFDVDFWNRLLPRVAAAEKPVQHALVAIAALHEETLTYNKSPLSPQPEVSLAQYNKAIRSLNQRISLEGENQQVILLTCIIFICLEFLRGMPERGLDHFQSGLKILISHKASSRASTNSSCDSPSSDVSELDEVDRAIEHAFSRLSIQASLVGRTPPRGFYQNIEVGPIHSPSNDFFSSLQEARDSLNVLIIQSLRPSDFLFPVNSTLIDVVQQSTDRYTLVACLNQWKIKLDLLIVEKVRSQNIQEMDAIRLLHIQSIVAIIWNSTTVSNNESDFDRYRAQFSNIVSLASRILDKPTSSTSSSNSSRISTPLPSPSSIPSNTTVASGMSSSPFLFALEMGIMFALYFTAIKCRCPIIRRDASSLLFRIEPQRQGIWNARILGKTSQYIIHFEEASSSVAVTCDTKSWPADEQRIHSAYNTPNHDPEKRVQEMTFVWRPGGPSGEWMFWSEEIYY